MQNISRIIMIAALTGAMHCTAPSAQANEPVANEPVANEPVANEPVANEPVANEPVIFASDADAAALNAWTERWRTFYNAGDTEAMRDMYTNDAVLMSHGGPRLIGKEAILAFLGRNKAAGNTANITFATEELIVEDKIAYWTAQYWLTITLADGRDIPIKGRSLLIFKKGDDGQWRLWRDMDNQAADIADGPS